MEDERKGRLLHLVALGAVGADLFLIFGPVTLEVRAPGRSGVALEAPNRKKETGAALGLAPIAPGPL